ncbi:stage II sporulation protein M [Chloroflexota bacterium]
MRYKRWLLVASFLFVIGFGGGLTAGLATPGGVADLFSEDVTALEEFANLLASLPQSSVFFLILVKNTSAVLISFALSPIFCLTPVMALILNGGLIGYVSVLVIQENSLGYLLAGLLPHGIFELPALIMGEAVSLSFGTAVLMALIKKERRSQLLPHLRQNLRYLLIALTLFLPAAIIETYITPLFLR